MSNSGSNDGIDLNLIDLDSSSSEPSSGEFYEPSSGVLQRARDTIDRTDELLGSTRYLLRSRKTKPHTETPEHQQITEHPENQQQSAHTENQQNSELPKHQRKTEHPEPRPNREKQQYSHKTEH